MDFVEPGLVVDSVLLAPSTLGDESAVDVLSIVVAVGGGGDGRGSGSLVVDDVGLVVVVIVVGGTI